MAKHSCDMCRPYRKELNRLNAFRWFTRRHSKADVEVAAYKLDIVTQLVCSDSPPELDEDYQSGGKHRRWFLNNRVTAKCPSCQRLADELLIVSESSRTFRAALREEMTGGSDGGTSEIDTSAGSHAALLTHHARALEELLLRCERIKCQSNDD